MSGKAAVFIYSSLPVLNGVRHIISQVVLNETNNAEDIHVYRSPPIEINEVNKIDLAILEQRDTKLTIPDCIASFPTSSVCTTRSCTTIKSNRSVVQ